MSKELLYLAIAGVAGQGVSLLHPVPPPDPRVGPRIVVGLIRQKLEEVMQRGEPTIDSGGCEPLCQLVFDEGIDITACHRPGRLADQLLKVLQVVNVVLGRAAIWIPTIQVPFEVSNSPLWYLQRVEATGTTRD